MQSDKLAGRKISASTQQYLDIDQVHDDTVILKDGTLRAVLMVSSINFALKAEQEQDALVIAYANMLNILDYPIQIVVQSRKLNVDNYMERLRQSEKTQTNELLKIQIADYRVFISQLIEMGQIMSKKFFVVVPFNPMTNRQKGFYGRLKETFAPVLFVAMRRDLFLKRKKDLDSRVAQVLSQLQNMGLTAVKLDTQGLIELYYNSYNPQLADVQKLTDLTKLQVEEE